MSRNLYDDEKNAIALYVKKLMENEDERRGKRQLKFAAIAALFSTAMLTAFGWLMLGTVEVAAINSLQKDPVTRLIDQRIQKAQDDSNIATESAVSAKKAASDAQKAASSASEFLQRQSQLIELSERFTAVMAESKKFVADISNDPIFQKKIGDQVSATLSPISTLAMIQVKNRQTVSASPGVSFDQLSGTVTFLNPRNLIFVPIVSDSKDATYITGTHWIRAILPPDRFIVRLKALDTGDRTFPPEDFTAIIVGFVAPSKP